LFFLNCDLFNDFVLILCGKQTILGGKRGGEKSKTVGKSRKKVGKNNLGGGKYCGTRPHID